MKNEIEKKEKSKRSNNIINYIYTYLTEQNYVKMVTFTKNQMIVNVEISSFMSILVLLFCEKKK